MASQSAMNLSGTLLMEVVVAARRLLAMQSRVNATIVPESLADAIERDFLLFDFQEAALDLRHAVEAAEAVTVAYAAGRSCEGGVPVLTQ